MPEAALVLYTRPGCHLCDDMKAVVATVRQTIPFTLEEVDISTDPELQARYGMEIPVLMVNGHKAAKYRVTEEKLRRLIESSSGE